MAVGTLHPVNVDDRDPFIDHLYDLGVEVLVRLEYSERLGAYYMTVFDADGATIYANRKVLAGYQIAIRQLDARLPDGVFFPMDLDNTTLPPTFDELGDRVPIFFVPTDEIPPDDPLTDAVSVEVV